MDAEDKRDARLEADLTDIRARLTSCGVEVSGGAGEGPQKEVALFLYLATSRASPVLGRTEIIACMGLHNDWYVVRPRALRKALEGVTAKGEAMGAIVRTAAR